MAVMLYVMLHGSGKVKLTLSTSPGVNDGYFIFYATVPCTPDR